MSSNEWVNPQRPVDVAGVPSCPVCGSEVIGPFSSTMANNKVVQKWGCSRCPYVAKIVGGFKTAFDANPISFG